MGGKYLYGLFACLLFHFSFGQQYFFSRYTPKNGLVNNRVTNLYQDSKGRLYVCTFGGLSVYDGSRFMNYTPEDGLASSLINDVMEMGDDSIWIIPNSRGIHCLVHGIFHNIPTADHNYPVVNQLLRRTNGEVYGVADEGLFRFDKDRWVRIPMIDSTGNDAGTYLVHAAESHGKLFVIKDPLVNSYPGAASLIIFDLASGRTIVSRRPSIFMTSVKSPEGHVLVSTGGGVRLVDEDALNGGILRLVPLSFPFGSANSIIATSLYFDRAGSLWLATAKGVIKIDRQGREQAFGVENGVPAGEVTAILEDKENNIWFANAQNGIAELVNQHVQLFPNVLPGFTIDDFYADANSDSVWCYDIVRRRLMLLAGNTHAFFQCRDSLPAAGQILIGKKSYFISNHSVYVLNFLPGNTFKATEIYHDSVTITGNSIFDKRGNLFVASMYPLFILDGKAQRLTLPNLADQVAIDRNNRLWAISRSDELFVFQIDEAGASLRLIRKYGKELPWKAPRSLAVDKEGRVWVGTRDHGLYCLFFDGLRLVHWKQLTMQNGLTENFINYLFCDPDNTIWACSHAGLNRIRIRNDRFTVENITPGNDLYETIRKILPTRDGAHWVLAQDGFLKINPIPEEKTDYLPPVLFSRVLVRNEPAPGVLSEPLSLPYDRNALAFYLGAPTFLDEGQTRYTYLLEGSQSPQWSSPSRQSVINFVNLPPGNYTLRVKAQFPTGRYPDQTGSYPFVIHEPWWQTWWWRALVLLVAAGLVTLGIRYYIRSKLEIQRTKLEKKQAIEKERARIATDMHDDLGAGLSRIKFLSETMHLKKQLGQPVQDDISSIGHYANEMIDKMGEIVWALNEKNDSLSDLLSYARSYAADYLIQSGIQCHIDGPGEVPNRFVSGEFRRNVYLTIKEALHNIVKHAQARKVEIRMAVDGELAITIQDDGVGFNPENVRPYSNGLGNMRQRIEDIGGRLEIRTEKGTQLMLTVDLPASGS
jgi:signal transduction histidine kinase/ligand-binding sensor domain-containing protein